MAIEVRLVVLAAGPAGLGLGATAAPPGSAASWYWPAMRAWLARSPGGWPVTFPAVWPPLPAGWPGRFGLLEDRVAYDEDLADRVRAVLPPAEAVTERQMFGGLAFMLGGHMFCGVVRDTLMVRLGPEGADRALNLPHVRPMDFTGRPVKGMVFVERGGLHGAALGEWVAAAAAFACALPPKPATRSARKRR